MTTPAKRGPGRPPLAEGEETRALYVRMPASTLDAVTGAAALRDESPVEYARRVLDAQARRDLRRADR